MKTITNKFAQEVKDNGSIEMNGVTYMTTDSNEIIFVNENCTGMFDFLGYCQVKG